jgi:hypothetical protein
MGELVMPDKPNCEAHSGNTVMIKAHEEQISDLYDKHTTVQKDVADIKVILAKMEVTMTNSFINAERQLKEVSCDIKKMNENREKTIAYYDAIVKGFNEKFAELDKFAWFRNFANRLRNVLIWGLFLVFAYLISIHWLDLGKYFTKKIG